MAEIIDGVWGEEGDEAPNRARGLPATMYRLRNTLADEDGATEGGSVLRHVGKAYRLDADPANIDRTVFLAELAAANAARRNRQPERAHALLTAALGRWSAPVALDGVPGPYAEHDRRMLAGRREEARQARLELDVELGLGLTLLAEPGAEPGTVVPHALALARAGHRERALALLAGSAPRGEAAALAARLRGRAPDLASWTPWASRTAPRPVRRPFQLPPDLADFTGRTALLTELAAALAAPGPRRVTVTGPPGYGKSALAVHAAHRLAPGYPDGQLHADLNGKVPLADPAAVLAAFVRALGVEEPAVPPGLADLRALYLRLLAGRRVLVLLDGAVGAEQVRPLLPAEPGSAALVTAGRPLPGGHTVTVGRMTPDEGIELLSRTLGAGRLAREPDAARALAAACDHHPGALRLAANRLARRPAWPISALLPHPGE
ncbi:BTAD domain-containing putative transcriptional regulator [Streptomyces sp. NRRL B-24484]|uniref:BTAD domain-containing putative transcriptional regulator n=1 Tax=Streptomyces sp. NRRL B-24484 TaxID=1463833 RepID=UPI001F178813|nr:BTAD domain-containing putative transcriptional regulator [Streptomyces sp. NRRL B-24484]